MIADELHFALNGPGDWPHNRIENRRKSSKGSLANTDDLDEEKLAKINWPISRCVFSILVESTVANRVTI